MNSSWVRERYARYSEKLHNEKLKKQGEANALSAFPSMFDRLKYQIQTDIQYYNSLFGSRATDRNCIANFEPTDDGFRVEVGPKAVRVRKDLGATIIKIERVTPGGVIANEHFQIVPNDDGQPAFNHGKRNLTDEEASEFVLTSVLCGE
jgi:hypothetical protein